MSTPIQNQRPAMIFARLETRDAEHILFTSSSLLSGCRAFEVRVLFGVLSVAIVSLRLGRVMESRLPWLVIKNSQPPLRSGQNGWLPTKWPVIEAQKNAKKAQSIKISARRDAFSSQTSDDNVQKTASTLAFLGISKNWPCSYSMLFHCVAHDSVRQTMRLRKGYT